MSKTKTLFTMALLVLLGSMGAVQAQTIARVTLLTATERAAREGGKTEAAGDVFLDIDGAPESIASYTLTYSVPVVASDVVTNLDGYDATESDLEKGLVAFGALSGGADTVVAITGVTLDVSKAGSGPVTVTLKLENAEEDLALLVGSDTGTVFTEVLPGVKATVKMGTVRTRGGEATATFTIEEGFNGAFEVGQRVEFEVQGLPEAVAIGMMADDAKPPNDGLDPPTDTPRPVMGAATLTGDADGDDKSVTLTLGDDDATAETARGELDDGVVITLTLMTDGEDVSLPLMVGEITARVTLVDTVMGTDTFDDAFTSPLVIFEIQPAQCTLLFPYVALLPSMSWNTGISVMNPGYEEEGVAGGLTLTFYGNDGAVADFSTEDYPTVGTGLDEMGWVPVGGTYSVLASEILAATDWGENFQGHIHVLADYTECNGVGWVTDFTKVNQAYVAVVLDADTGSSE